MHRLRHYNIHLKEMRYSDINSDEFHFTENGIQYIYKDNISNSNDYSSFKIDLFSGLKDKNGLDIFESDVINAYNSSKGIWEVGILSFDNGTFTLSEYWDDGTHDWKSMEQYDCFELEVTGSSHTKDTLNIQ